MHIIKFVKVFHKFRVVVRAHRRVVVRPREIRIGVPRNRTSRWRNVTVKIGSNFGLCANTVCWLCLIYILFATPDGIWYSAFGVVRIGGSFFQRSGARAIRWSSNACIIDWNGRQERRLVLVEDDLE